MSVDALRAEGSISLVFSVSTISLLMVPIPTLKDGMTIGDTIDVIVVAMVDVFAWLDSFIDNFLVSKVPVSVFDISRTLVVVVMEV